MCVCARVHVCARVSPCGGDNFKHAKTALLSSDAYVNTAVHIVSLADPAEHVNISILVALEVAQAARQYFMKRLQNMAKHD